MVDGLAMYHASDESKLLERLDDQQDQVLKDLDQLNSRVENVIRTWMEGSLPLDDSNQRPGTQEFSTGILLRDDAVAADGS